MQTEVPKYRIPDDSMPGNVAAQIIRDELLLDGSPGLNVASFVNTFVEQDVKELIMDAMTKNAIDAGAWQWRGTGVQHPTATCTEPRSRFAVVSPQLCPQTSTP